MAHSFHPARDRPVFEHEKLDHNKRSIRLFKILPELSYDGLIQCELWHTTVEDEHDCLSYVWGPEGDEQEILVNGKSLQVRKNLWTFLNTIRPKYAISQRAIWTDYICIKQNSRSGHGKSSNSELNHQVAMMHKIYSGAREVVGWLGYSDRIERTFVFWRELNALKPETYHDTLRMWNNHLSKRNKELKKDWKELAGNSYWKRAWITQEILSARKFRLLANNSEVEVGKVPGISKLLPRHSLSYIHPQVYIRMQTFYTYLGALCESVKVVGSRFISLFHLLPGRESENPRDRIYSLRSIASDGASIAVDYDSSDKEVLFQLLEIFKHSLCPCFVAYMVQALELENCQEIFDASEQKRSLFEIKMKESLTTRISGASSHSQLEPLSTYYIRDLMTSLASEVRFYSPIDCMKRMYLNIKRFRGHDGKEKHAIKANHHEDWVEVPSTKTINELDLCEHSEQAVYYNCAIYLTAGVLISLLPILLKEPGSKDTYRLCRNARNAVGTDSSCKIVSSTASQERDPCCSKESCPNKVCIEVYQLGLSKQYIESEIQHGKWAADPAIIERFLSEDAPWVPSYIRDPSSSTIFPQLFADAGTQRGPKKRKASSSCDSMRVRKHSSCCLTECDDEIQENVSNRSYFGDLLVC